MPMCANMLRNNPASSDQGCSTASQGSDPVMKLAHLPLFQHKTYLQNRLHQLITHSQSQTMPKASSVVKGLNMWPTVCNFPIP